MSIEPSGHIMLDALFVAKSRDPQAYAVGERFGHQWCHLWCNPGDEQKLHIFAQKIGMRREWFQDKTNFPHYDLTPYRRKLALQQGAVETDIKLWLKQRT